MIADIVYALFLTGVGGLLAFVLGIRGWVLPGFGFLLGVSVVSLIGAIQALVWMSIAPVYTLIAAIVILLVVCVTLRIHKAIDHQVLSKNLVLVAITFVCIVAAAWIAQIFTYIKHVDSMQYIAIGSMLYSDIFAEEINLFQIPKRMLTLPALHASAGLVDRYYFKILSPLVALSSLLLVAWFILQGLKNRVDESVRVYAALLGVLILLTNNRFVMHAFYLNNHLLVALLLLTIVGSGWLLTRGPVVATTSLRAIQLMALPPLLFARPEGALLACVAIMPSLVSDSVPRFHKAALLVVTGSIMIIWQYFLISLYTDAGRTVPFSMRGLLFLGATLLLVAPLLFWNPIQRILGPWALIAAESAIWLGLAIAAFVQPEVFFGSFSATFQNVVLDGASWGISIVLLAALTLLVIVLAKDPDRIYLRFPITVFVPLSFLLAHLREGAYRVGDGDSLNRMIIHIVPLAIVFLATSVAANWRVSPQSKAGTSPKELS